MKDQPGKTQNVPRCQGRLNTVVEADLFEEWGMVEGTISLHSQHVFVLIDTGASYSFISTTFAATLPIKPIPLKSKINVASPLGSESKLTHYLPKSETIIGGHNLSADLICLDMKGYDAILGVDWLIEYDADSRGVQAWGIFGALRATFEENSGPLALPSPSASPNSNPFEGGHNTQAREKSPPRSAPLVSLAHYYNN
ncbi:hypothetical protein Taro_025703 [Colocasia esculenta]|uniref:Uncharacterized protein n=1 Tax=Colocasia esculenta TaxID=4460 RepID=A0A843VA17_COLES|nr:hypothetical protein [Colocasia esculenta]